MNWQDADLVLMDLDGTLVNSVPDLAAAIDAMLDALGYPPATEPRVSQWVGNGADKLVERALNHCGSKYDLDTFDKARELFNIHYDRLNGQKTKLYPGVLPFLNQCRQLNKITAVVTNKPMRFTLQLLKNMGIDQYFDQVVGGDSYQNKKPHPQPLQEVISAREARSPIMIGDSEHDVSAARAAGIPVICVTYGYNHGNDIKLSKPDLVIDSLQQLL